MARLAGKVALISGGARGQGAVEARMFTQEGAKVVFGDILDKEGKQVEAAIRAQGGEATYVHLNVTREEDWQRAVHTAESMYGKLDVLVNNAGIAIRGAIEETSEEGLASGPALEARWGKPAHTLPADHPAWALAARYLALGLVTFICTLAPQRIIMGGGILHQEHVFPRVRHEVQQLLNNYIQVSELHAQLDDYIVPPALGDQA